MACKPIVAPLVGAWIEICQYSVCCEELSVAPLVGAWIEIGFRLYLSCSIGVAPLVGAWIEMMLSPKRFPEPVVAPLVGAWIEISKGMSASEWIKSLPSWERGLKCFQDLSTVWMRLSLPSWERGLKYLMLDCGLRRQEVAPLVGAWIEIFLSSSGLPPICCRSPRGSAD